MFPLLVSLALMAAPATTEIPDTTGLNAFRQVFLPGAVAALDSTRAQRYITRLDHDVAVLADGFDFEAGLFVQSGDMPPTEIANLDRHARKAYAGGKYHWLYRMGRNSASAIGSFALAWATPGSRHYGDERFRQGVVNGLEAYLEHQLPSGEFAFSSIRYSSVYGTHEMAWRLEPLLAAYLCVRHTLSPEQAERIHAGLERGADYLQATVCDSQSNRGCVWCGVMAVAARLFERPDYLGRVHETWAWVGRRVLNESGMVTEGPGPDFTYSYISFSYTFLQRLATGDETLDAPLMRALDWFCGMHDSAGLPMQAVSTRLGRHEPDRLAFLLGALEYYAPKRPYYATLAAEYLTILERQREPVATDHGSIMWLAAALYHDSTVTPAPLPDRLRRFTEYTSFDVTQYLNVRRAYHTLLMYSGVKDLTGLQHWCLEGERPLLFEYPGGASGIRAWGIDTARTKLRSGYRRDSSALETSSVDWSGIRTCYVFGEAATWVINVAPDRPRELSWAINRAQCAKPTLEGHAITSEGQRSRIDIGPAAPTLEAFERGWQVVVTLSEAEPIDWTVLHDGSAGAVHCSLKEGLLVGQLSEDEVRYELVFNATEGGASHQDNALAPLEARMVRVE